MYRTNCGISSAGSGGLMLAQWQLFSALQVEGSQLYQDTRGSVTAEAGRERGLGELRAEV